MILERAPNVLTIPSISKSINQLLATVEPSVDTERIARCMEEQSINTTQYNLITQTNYRVNEPLSPILSPGAQDISGLLNTIVKNRTPENIRSLTNAIATSSRRSLSKTLQKVIEEIGAILEHPNPSIRKAAVFVFVELWAKFGREFQHHLESLPPVPRELITVFYNRRLKALKL